MNKPALRIGFAGTPEFAAEHLSTLLQESLNLVCVYTQPDRPAGRGKQAQASAVKKLAIKHNLPVLQPASLKTYEAEEEFKAFNLDVLIVVAYGLILPKSILDIPNKGCINVHASLLPRWRGAAPIERAILAGDQESGITIMQMDAGLDTGDMLCRKATTINSDDTSASLTLRLVKLGQTALLETLKQIHEGSLNPIKQDDSLSTYARKLDKKESLISWNTSAEKIQRQVNAFYPRSPAYTFYDGQRLRIIEALSIDDAANEETGTIVQISNEGIKVCCSSSCLLIKRFQLSGKSETGIKEFLNGRKDFFTLGSSFSFTENEL